MGGLKACRCDNVLYSCIEVLSLLKISWVYCRILAIYDPSSGFYLSVYISLGIYSLLLLAGISWSGDLELKIWVDLLTSFAVIF